MVILPNPTDRIGRHIMQALAANPGKCLTVAELVAAVTTEYPLGGVACSLVVARLWRPPTGAELPVVLARPKGSAAYVYQRRV